MSWPNLFSRNDENTRHAWGYDFQWTPQHMTLEEMHPLKYSYDVLGEECLNRLDSISPPTTGELPRSRSRTSAKVDGEPPAKSDMYALLRDHASEDEKLGDLWKEVNTIPDWVDWDQIARGQDVFYRYGGVALTALAYQSLLGGMGAARVSQEAFQRKLHQARRRGPFFLRPSQTSPGSCSKAIPYLDKRKLKALRRIFYHVIVENKTHGLGEETNFDFKYIPNFDTTPMGEHVSGLKESGVERRNLRMATAFMGVVSYFCLKTTSGIVGSIRGWWFSRL